MRLTAALLMSHLWTKPKVNGRSTTTAILVNKCFCIIPEFITKLIDMEQVQKVIAVLGVKDLESNNYSTTIPKFEHLLGYDG